jgi:hypothetical protein
MRRLGPDVAISVALPLRARVRADTHEVVGDLVAVGWNRSTDTVYIHDPKLEYLVYDPEAGDLAWFAASEVAWVSRADDGHAEDPRAGSEHRQDVRALRAHTGDDS